MAIDREQAEALLRAGQSGICLWNQRRLTSEAIPPLDGVDLSNANLRGVDLHDANLTGANLSQADLSGANLSNAILRNVVFVEAILAGASLSGAVQPVLIVPLTTNLERAHLAGTAMIEASELGPPQDSVRLPFQ
jgi:hypothetical protein